MSNCGTSAWRAGKRANSTPRSWFLFILLSYVCFINLLSPTLANERTTIDNQRAKLLEKLTNKEMSKCLKPLESSSRFMLSLRMYVRPLGPGSDNLHMAGKVDVHDDLPVGSGWSKFRYQYTSLEKEIILKVWVNDTELPYIASRNFYIERYEFNNVNVYMQGRMEMYDGDECSPPASTTATSMLSSTQSTLKETSIPGSQKSPANNTSTNPDFHTITTTSESKTNTRESIPGSRKSPANTTSTNPDFHTINTTSEPKTCTNSGILVTKSASILTIVGVLAVILISAVVFLVWRCRNSRTEETMHPFSVEHNEQITQLVDHPNDECSVVPQRSLISSSVTRNNPVYVSPSSSVNAASPSAY